MSEQMGSGSEGVMLDPGGVLYPADAFVRIDDFARTSPSKIWVFIDEHEGTIDGPGFPMRWVVGPSTYWSAHWPSARHGRRGVLSFVDGHVEIHKWLDPRTGPNVHSLAEVWNYGWNAYDSVDYAWLWEHTNGPWPPPQGW